MRRQELSGSVQRRARFVKDRIIGLEDVGHARGDVERDLDVGGGGSSREADGVVEENLVTSGLDDQGRQAGQVGGELAAPPRTRVAKRSGQFELFCRLSPRGGSSSGSAS